MLTLGFNVSAGFGTDPFPSAELCQQELICPWKSFVRLIQAPVRLSELRRKHHGQQMCRFLPAGLAPVSHHSQNMGTDSWNVSKDINSCGFKEGLYEFTRTGTDRVESVDTTCSGVSQHLPQLPELKKGFFSQNLGFFLLPDALLGPTDDTTSHSQIIVLIKTFIHPNPHILPLAHNIKLSMLSLF